MNCRFRPAYYLAQVVFAGGKSVVATQRGQPCHHAKLPDKACAYMSGRYASRSKGGTTPRLPERIHRCGFGKTGDLAVVVFVRPLDVAVWTAERAEVESQSVDPHRGVLGDIARLIGSADRPTYVVNGITLASRSAKVAEIKEAVMIRLLLRRQPKRKHKRGK